MPFDCINYHPQDEILRVLSAAQERIREPENWCQRSLAKRADGNGCWPEDQEAAQWCAVGALAAEVTDERGAKAYLIKAAREMGYSRVSELNNRTDHLSTLAMFSHAIELRLADMAKEAVHAI